MKRVKVERYVAGKKPIFAKDDEDDEYITDDEYDEHQSHQSNEESDDSTSDESMPVLDTKPNIKEESDLKPELPLEEEDDDDPRFRHLKRIESKPSTSKQLASGPQSGGRVEQLRTVIDEDEDEEDIRQRHILARARKIEEPIGPQAVFGDLFHDRNEVYDQELSRKRDTTDDLLKDFKLTGLVPKQKNSEKEKLEESIKEALDKAREVGIFKASVEKRLEEDIKADAERELKSKGTFGTKDMNAVNTDDEDEDIAYEQWKVREIQRVLRDRKERALALESRSSRR